MISVCIPVYNYHVVPLANQLVEQAKATGAHVELVFIDDFSSLEFREKNAPLKELGTYIQLDKNVGRARIRNLFLKYTQGDYLLFLDNDSIVKEGFMAKYLEVLDHNPQVVVGGRVCDRHSDRPECHLRYLYGVEVESRKAAERAQHPYRSFITNNFFVKREVLEKIPFDERLNLYGHEDTLFGFRLEQNKIPILHIDNPVVNGDIETNQVFLAKTEEAIQNLLLLYNAMAGDERFCSSVRLLATYRRIHSVGMVGPVYLLFRIMRRPLLSHFLNGNAISVRQFSFYKLGLFIQKKHYTNQKIHLS